MAQVAERLPRKGETLSSNLNQRNKQINKKSLVLHLLNSPEVPDLCTDCRQKTHHQR
jgi:hypothetical protein